MQGKIEVSSNNKNSAHSNIVITDEVVRFASEQTRYN